MPEGNADPLTILATIQMNVATPTAVLDGQVVLAALAAPLSAVSVPIKSVTIENVSTNAVVNVGNATTQRYQLRAGATISLAIDDLNKVYVSGTAAQAITFIAVN